MFVYTYQIRSHISCIYIEREREIERERYREIPLLQPPPLPPTGRSSTMVENSYGLIYHVACHVVM